MNLRSQNMLLQQTAYILRTVFSASTHTNQQETPIATSAFTVPPVCIAVEVCTASLAVCIVAPVVTVSEVTQHQCFDCGVDADGRRVYVCACSVFPKH